MRKHNLKKDLHYLLMVRINSNKSSDIHSSVNNMCIPKNSLQEHVKQRVTAASHANSLFCVVLKRRPLVVNACMKNLKGLLFPHMCACIMLLRYQIQKNICKCLQNTDPDAAKRCSSTA